MLKKTANLLIWISLLIIFIFSLTKSGNLLITALTMVIALEKILKDEDARI